MKKVLISLTLLSILAVLFIPLVRTQGMTITHDESLPNECCEMKYDVTIGDTTYNKGKILGANEDKINCTLVTDDNNDNNVIILENGYSLYCLLGTIYWVTNLVFLAAILLVVILIIVGGIMIMTAAGDEAKVKKGKNFILYALIGFVVAILAKAVPALAKFFIGM